jgi:putative FmdB family regulatory protein
MPLYEYQCQECGARSEHLQRIDDPPPESCSACGRSGSLRRLLSSPAFQFKGSGWYVTDYARSSGSGGTKAESAETTSKPAAESKADTATPASSPAPAASSTSDG